VREDWVMQAASMPSMSRLAKLWHDFLGLGAICGWSVALRWLRQLVFSWREVLYEKNLQPVDRALGPGPWKVRLRTYGCEFLVWGPQSISGIREMYVRDVYLRGG